MLQKTKSLLTKCLAFLFIVCCVVAATVGLVACSNEKTIASIRVNNGKLIVEYSDGTTEDPIDLVAPACTHTETNEVSILQGCELKTLHICKKCGAIASITEEESHDYVSKHLGRKNCMVSARTADVCTRCGKEANVVYDDETANLADHPADSVKEVTYKLDPGHESDFCICESDIVTAKICTKCGETLEVIDVKKAPGHTFGDWKIKDEPTDGVGGTLERICTTCNNKHIEEGDDRIYATIPSLKVLNDKKEPTTEVNKEYTYVKGEGFSCSADGRTDLFTFTAPDGKTLSVKKVIKNQPHHVVVDGVIKNITLGGVALDVAEYPDKFTVIGGAAALTCKKAGSPAVFTCEECGDVYNVNVKKAHAAYKDTDTVVAKLDATCDKDGYIDYVCSATGCGETARKVLAKIGHNFAVVKDGIIEPTGENTKWTFKVYCTRCDAKIDDIVTDEKPTINKVEATCTEGAYTVYTDIKDADGKVMVDANNKPLEVKIYTSKALGHIDPDLGLMDLTEGAAYDLNSAKYKEFASKFTAIGGAFTCKEYDSVSKSVDGVYKCEACGVTFSVKLYKSHTGTDTITEEPTCRKAGKRDIDCTECKQKITGQEVPALGDVYNWTVVADEDGKVTSLKGECIHKDCDGISTVTEVAGVNFKSAVVEKDATCKDTGTVIVTKNDDKTETRVIAKSEYHTLNKEVVKGTADEPCKVRNGFTPIGRKFTCKKSELTAPNAIFVCDVCGDTYTTYVLADHTKVNHEIDVEPTCTTKGHEKFTCSECGDPLENDIDALKHDLEYSAIDMETGKFTITCKREGCALHGEEGKITVQLKPYNDILVSKEGKLVIDDETAKEIGYIVKVDANDVGTCEKAGRYTFTLTKKAYKELLVVALGDNADGVEYFDLDHVVSFVVVEGAEHDTSEDPSTWVTWVYEGHTYRGALCSVCGNMVIKTIDGKIVK